MEPADEILEAASFAPFCILMKQTPRFSEAHFCPKFSRSKGILSVCFTGSYRESGTKLQEREAHPGSGYIQVPPTKQHPLSTWKRVCSSLLRRHKNTKMGEIQNSTPSKSPAPVGRWGKESGNRDRIHPAPIDVPFTWFSKKWHVSIFSHSFFLFA